MWNKIHMKSFINTKVVREEVMILTILFQHDTVIIMLYNNYWLKVFIKYILLVFLGT